MNGGLIFLIILLVGLVLGYGGWVLWSRLRASRLGLPPPSLNPFARSAASSNYPSPAPGGIQGFFQTQLRKLRNRNNRSAAGAYEAPSHAARGRGSNRLDPDEAWDAHVGNEAYYEEQELGLHAPPQHHGHTPYGAPSPGFAPEEAPRGRSRTREYEEDAALGVRGARADPFGDEHAASLRGVSPRPLEYGVDTSYGGAAAAQQQQHGGKTQRAPDSAENSPTESRRSVFRENM